MPERNKMPARYNPKTGYYESDAKAANREFHALKDKINDSGGEMSEARADRIQARVSEKLAELHARGPNPLEDNAAAVKSALVERGYTDVKVSVDHTQKYGDVIVAKSPVGSPTPLPGQERVIRVSESYDSQALASPEATAAAALKKADGLQAVAPNAAVTPVPGATPSGGADAAAGGGAAGGAGGHWVTINGVHVLIGGK
jgi:hypothetical protein